MSKKLGTLKLAGVLTSSALVAASLTGCSPSGNSDDAEDEQVYCALEDGTILDPSECERRNSSGGGSSIFIWHAPGATYRDNFKPGDKLPTGGSKFPYNDSASRTAMKLPATGKITTGGFGTKVSGSGGFGKGFGVSRGG
ncbi:MAG TPA: hypothetical protein VK497_01335 [Candidatus Saccharimonadales bacterium]|nr:hypothetical protein [Candidatus Saccharimonadales bacterium]